MPQTGAKVKDTEGLSRCVLCVLAKNLWNNQILGRFFEYYVKHYFIIEPRFNVVAGYGKFHVIPFSCLYAAGAHCRLCPAVAADLFNGMLCVAVGAEVELAIVLGIHIVEHDNETLRTAVFAGSAMDGVVVRGDDIFANSQRRLLTFLMLQDARNQGDRSLIQA